MAVWQRVARGSFWLNVDQGLRAATELAVAALLARLLTQEVFGQYQLLLSVFMVASLATLSGFNGSLLRALAQGKDGTLDAVTRLSWRWSAVGVLALAGLGAYWYGWVSRSLGSALLLTALLLPFFHVLRRWQVVLHAKEQFRLRAQYNLVASASLLVGVGVVAWWRPNDLAWLFLVYVAITAFWQTVFYGRSRRWLTNAVVEAGWMRSGYKLLLSELFGVLYAHLDKLLLAAWLGAEGLAVYATAIVIGEGTKLVLGNVVLAYVPRLHRQETGELLRWLGRSAPILALALTALLGMLWLLVPVLIELLFSERYLAGVPFARWYLLVVPGHLVASVLGYILVKERREGSMLASFAAAGLINVLLYVVLIPQLGLMGAVIGSTGYYVALASAMTALFFRGRWVT